MKTKMQIMLTLTVIILFFVGSALFLSLSYNFLLKELQRQIVEDNKVIGEQILTIFNDLDLHQIDEDRQRDILQNMCDTIKLPNDGFICAASDSGDILAFPGLKPGDNLTFRDAKLYDLDQENRQQFLEYPPEQRFSGLIEHGEGQIDIVASVPIKDAGIRMFVHQNIDSLKEKTYDFIRPLILFGIGITLVIGVITYLLSDRVIKRYEHQLEVVNHKLEQTNRELMVEKKKTDKLLLNILPPKVANDLKEKGKTEPESFSDVTVLFCDFINFTKMSSTLDPQILISELNEIFTAFDNIMEKHECQRIKTIGDAYLAVCGMPTPNPNHAENMVNAAVEIVQYLHQRNEKANQEPDDTMKEWHIRIGIHTGKVVGGVVGIKKYIYDVFGDTINTASRMESLSGPMKINISEDTHQIIKNKFDFEERNPILVKGKGKMMMYFVTP